MTLDMYNHFGLMDSSALRDTGELGYGHLAFSEQNIMACLYRLQDSRLLPLCKEATLHLSRGSLSAVLGHDLG